MSQIVKYELNAPKASVYSVVMHVIYYYYYYY